MNKLTFLYAGTAALLLAGDQISSNQLTERNCVAYLSRLWNLQSEVRLWDGSRVDLMGDNIVIEVDWARKWAEGVGQATWYSIITGKTGVVVLLVKDWSRERHFCYRGLATGVRSNVLIYPVFMDDIRQRRAIPPP